MSNDRKQKQITSILVCVILLLCMGAYMIIREITRNQGASDAYRDMYEHEANSITFFAEVTDTSNNMLTVDGIDENDINYRGEFFVPINKRTTTLEWRGTEIEQSDINVGDMVAVKFYGDVLETSPAQIQTVLKITLLDDEK